MVRQRDNINFSTPHVYSRFRVDTIPDSMRGEQIDVLLQNAYDAIKSVNGPLAVCAKNGERLSPTNEEEQVWTVLRAQVSGNVLSFSMLRYKESII